MDAKYTKLFTDSDAFSLYRFRNGALTTDAKNGYTLTIAAGTPTYSKIKYGGGVLLDTSAYYSRNTQFWNGFQHFTINVWLKSWYGVITSGKSGTYEFYWAKTATTLSLHMRWVGNTDGDYSVTLPAWFDDSKVNMFTWTVTYSGGDTNIRVYLNAVLIYNTWVLGKVPSPWEAPYYIGAYYIEGKQGANGRMTNHFMMTRYVTAKEVKSLYVDPGVPLAAIG